MFMPTFPIISKKNHSLFVPNLIYSVRILGEHISIFLEDYSEKHRCNECFGEFQLFWSDFLYFRSTTDHLKTKKAFTVKKLDGSFDDNTGSLPIPDPACYLTLTIIMIFLRWYKV